VAAAITSSIVTISDQGSGVRPEVVLVVTLGTGETIRTVLSGDAAIGLTPVQMTALQNAVDAVRTKAVAKTKTNLALP
jgi:hypothetical protein